MNTTTHTRTIEDPVKFGGLVWSQLHSEREDVCEAFFREPHLRSTIESESEELSVHDRAQAERWHRELLQSRLRKTDSALDRLMSGSYGKCRSCERLIDNALLAFDHTIEFCPDCWKRQKDRGVQTTAATTRFSSSPAVVSLPQLAPFTTIGVRTTNSEYRIFLLDPRTGRSLVEGGLHLLEPVEAMITGSAANYSHFKDREIVIGHRLQMWVKDHLLVTSTVRSVSVEQYPSIESFTTESSGMELQWTK